MKDESKTMAHHKVTITGRQFDKDINQSFDIPFIIDEPPKSLAHRAREVTGFTGYSTSPAIIKDNETVLIIFNPKPNKNAKRCMPGGRITITLIK